jgi:hypothetical protein
VTATSRSRKARSWVNAGNSPSGRLPPYWVIRTFLCDLYQQVLLQVFDFVEIHLRG